MRNRAYLLAAAAVMAASPAFATGEIGCSGGGAGVDLLVGRLPVLYVDRAVITIGGRIWSTRPDDADETEISVGQAFEDDRMLVVDFTDADVSEVIARLRVFSLSEGEHYASGGVFSMRDEGAWVVDCSLRG